MAGLGLLKRYKDSTHVGAPFVQGRVAGVTGSLLEGFAAGAAVGDLYRVGGDDGPGAWAEVVALRDDKVLMVPYGAISGIRIGDALLPQGGASQIPVSEQMLGRVLNALGQPMDRKGSLPVDEYRKVYGEPLPALERRQVNERMCTGVRVLDTFVPAGKGQRLGIFAGPGVGKSVLMGMIARASTADVIVMALVGERGREVGHFIHEILGVEGLKRSVLVVATSDKPANERVRAAFVATTIAEYFRDKGADVVLFVDSLTRFAMGQREVGLAVGEPPTTKGYPPSVFSMLPKLLERVSPSLDRGTITGLYTVLVEGDDMTDPVADAAKGLLDGHVSLSRDLANRGQYPAVDVLSSISRVETEIATHDELLQTRKLRNWIATIEDSQDLISIGAYRKGMNPELDMALTKSDGIKGFMMQDIHEIAPLDDTLQRLRTVAN